LRFVPPYGSNGALYVRPFMFGSGQRLGLGPSKEFIFIVMGMPTGVYYSQQSVTALDCAIVEEFDRAAAKGVGGIKCAGNYGADIKPVMTYKERGFPIGLYLDSATRTYVEEFNVSNFVAITKDGKYLTPPAGKNTSVLDSVTNRSLEVLAVDMGLKVERRPINFLEEVDNWKEVAAVGTAVVTTPIQSITWGEKRWEFADGQGAEVVNELRTRMQAIQLGEAEDKYGWCREIPGIADDAGAYDTRSLYPPL